jgi:hypothetical protein
MVIAILGDKPGDGLTGQGKGHRVEQRTMLAETSQKFVSYIVESRKNAARSNTETAARISCGPHGHAKGAWVEWDAECRVSHKRGTFLK